MVKRTKPDIFLVVSHEKTGGNRHRLKYRKFHSKPLLVRVVEPWNMLPTAALEPLSLVMLETQPDTVLIYLM